MISGDKVGAQLTLPPCKGAEATGATLGDVGPWALGASAVPKNSSTHLFRWEIAARGSPHLVTPLPRPHPTPSLPQPWQALGLSSLGSLPTLRGLLGRGRHAFSSSSSHSEASASAPRLGES